MRLTPKRRFCPHMNGQNATTWYSPDEIEKLQRLVRSVLPLGSSNVLNEYSMDRMCSVRVQLEMANPRQCTFPRLHAKVQSLWRSAQRIFCRAIWWITDYQFIESAFYLISTGGRLPEERSDGAGDQFRDTSSSNSWGSRPLVRGKDGGTSDYALRTGNYIIGRVGRLRQRPFGALLDWKVERSLAGSLVLGPQWVEITTQHVRVLAVLIILPRQSKWIQNDARTSRSLGRFIFSIPG